MSTKETMFQRVSCMDVAFVVVHCGVWHPRLQYEIYHVHIYTILRTSAGINRYILRYSIYQTKIFKKPIKPRSNRREMAIPRHTAVKMRTPNNEKTSFINFTFRVWPPGLAAGYWNENSVSSCGYNTTNTHSPQTYPLFPSVRSPFLLGANRFNNIERHREKQAR